MVGSLVERTGREDERLTAPEGLARHLKLGRPEAVQEVRRRVKRMVAYDGLTIPLDERDDLEQEVMADIWRAVTNPGFDFSGGFWGFVEVVTSRRCIDWLRARRDKLALSEELASPAKGPLGDALERERAELATEVLSALDARCRELVTLRLRDDLSYAEIARALGGSEGALRVQLHRCVGRARQLVKRIGRARASDRGEASK